MSSSDYTPLAGSDAVGLNVSDNADALSVASASPSHLSIGRNSPLNPARSSPSSGFDEKLLPDDVEAGQSINSSKSGGGKAAGSTTPSKDRRAWNPARNTLLGSKMRYYSVLRNQAATTPSPHTGNTPRVVRGRVDSFLAPPESVIPPTCTFKHDTQVPLVQCTSPACVQLALPLTFACFAVFGLPGSDENKYQSSW